MLAQLHAGEMAMARWSHIKVWFLQTWPTSRQERRLWRRAIRKRLRYRIYWSYRVIRQVVRQATANRLPSAAAEMAFNSILALFPMLLLLVTVGGKLADRSSLSGALTKLSQVAPALVLAVPPRVIDLFEVEWVSMARQQSRQSVWLQAIAALWIASACLMPAIRALDNSYGIPRQHRRAWWLSRLLAVIIVTGAAVAVAIASVSLIVVQPILTWGATRAGWDGTPFWGAITWVLSLAVMALALAAIYRLAPTQAPVRAPIWPGALAGSIVWLASAVGFRWYVLNFDRYGAVYGSISAAIVLMLWLYLGAFGILVGGEINAAIFHVRAAFGRRFLQRSQPTAPLNPLPSPRPSLPASPSETCKRNR